MRATETTTKPSPMAPPPAMGGAVGQRQVRRVTLRLVTDVAGLLPSVGLGLLLPDVAGSSMAPLSLLIGAALLGSFRPSRAALPTDRNLRMLAVPLVTALATLILLAAQRDYYSGRYLALFTVTWTTWMLLARAFLARVASRPRLLLAAPTAAWLDLTHADTLDVTVSDVPPDALLAWDGVILDPRTRYDDTWLAWLASANVAGVPTLDADTLTENLTGRVALERLEDRWAFTALTARGGYEPVKRVLDVTFTLVLLPLVAPLALLLAVATYLQDGSPVLYRQRRVGRNGEPFTVLKFRTMREPVGDVSDAQRVTPVGTMLRRFHVDELPQFWNVLRGDMSIVGPRPETVDLVAHYEREIPLFPLRHATRPGITGWAQVSRGYTTGVQGASDKLQYDFYYVKHRSAWLDLRILLRTLPAIVHGAGSPAAVTTPMNDPATRADHRQAGTREGTGMRDPGS